MDAGLTLDVCMVLLESLVQRLGEAGTLAAGSLVIGVVFGFMA
jgi:hypothetical protein